MYKKTKNNPKVALLLAISLIFFSKIATANSNNTPATALTAPTFTFYIQLPQSNATSNAINVTLSMPQGSLNNNTTTATFTMPINTTNQPKSLKINDFANNITVLNHLKKTLPIKIKNQNIEILQQAPTATNIQYTVHNLPNAKNNYQAGNPIINTQKKLYIITYNGFFGYIQGYENAVYNIVVQKNIGDSLKLAATFPPTHSSAQADTFKNLTLTQLLQTTLMYSPKIETTTLTIENKNFEIFIYDETKNTSCFNMYYFLKPVIKSVLNFYPQFPFNQYRFIFYLPKKNSPNTALNSPQYGGITTHNTSFYVLPALPNALVLKRWVQRLAMHELLHTITPYTLKSEYIKTDYTYNFDIENSGNNLPPPQNTAYLWFYEGFTEYLTLLLLQKNELITEFDFWNAMATKIRLTEQKKPVNLWQLSKNIHKSKYKPYYGSFYDKAVIVALMLDIEIQALTNKKYSVPAIVLHFANEVYGQNGAFNEDTFLEEWQKFINKDLHIYINTYIKNNTNIPYSLFLKKIGMQYIPTAPRKTGLLNSLGGGEAEEVVIEGVQPVPNAPKTAIELKQCLLKMGR